MAIACTIMHSEALYAMISYHSYIQQDSMSKRKERIKYWIINIYLGQRNSIAYLLLIAIHKDKDMIRTLFSYIKVI